MDQRSQTFGVLVRAQRVRAGLSQLELAGQAGLSVRALREIERDRVRQPRARAVSGLVGALRLPEADRQGFLAAASGAADQVNGRIRVGVLGPLTVHRGSTALEITGSRRRVLLGLLAIQPNQVVAADEIIECLWGGDPPATCRSLVHGHIGALRRLLEAARDPRGPAGTLVRAGGGYLLVAGDDDVDLSRFDRLVARARALIADGDAAAAEETYAEALDRWRGPALSDLKQPALRQHPVVVAVSGRRLIAALAYTDLALASGHPNHAVERLQALVADEPLHEGLHARLILALAATGRQATALSRYNDVRARLADELGLEPGPDLRAAHLRVLRQEVPTAAPQPTTHTAGPAGAGVPPAQLPTDLPTFTGRAPEMRRLGALPRRRRGSAGVNIVVVAGTAGVGKTSLVVHWAHRTAPRFPDGQLYADLRGYATAPAVRPEEVLARFLHALGVPVDQVPADRDEAAALYRSLMVGRRILVVLDNARDAQHVRPLLPGSPSCLVLVTSRNRLTGLSARESARHVTLDVLTPGEAHRLLTRILPAARVRNEPATVDPLAQVCAYLPLALSIAAANVAGEGIGVAAYLMRLSAGNQLTELKVDGDPDTAVRAAFDLSYAVLAPDTARLFRLLGVVPGPDITAEAAAVLVGAPVDAAGRLLDALAATHLVGQPAPSRYAFHDLLRRYAADLAMAKEGGPACAAAVARLLEYYLRRLHDGARLLHPEKLRIPLPPGMPGAAEPFPNHAAALAWLDAEWPNLLAATQHAARYGPPSVVWRLADALRGYLWLRSYPVDWLTVARAGLAAAKAEGDLRAEVTARLSLGDVHRYQGQYPLAVEQYRRALALAEEAAWPAAESAILGNLGNAYSDVGRPGEGASNYARALEIDRRTGRLEAEAVNLGNLGFVYQELGRFDEAADLHRRALALDRRLGARGSEAIDLANLGETCHALGRTVEATTYLTRALDMHREVGDRRGEAEALYSLAAVHLDGGRHERARTLATTAVMLARDTAERRVEAEALNTMSLVDHQTGRQREAIEHGQLALEVAREAGIRHAEAVALIGLAVAHHALNDDGIASAYAQLAREMADRCGYRRLTAQALLALADMDAAAGRLAEAVAGWAQALTVFDQLGCPESGQVRDRLHRHGAGRGCTARADPERG